ncbi:MAG: energy-coupling factor ABC transporter ATP-binding protein [Deferribacteraceae bacterium]|nr:energy-coupling factor ABC transporter ATP-binding protein [Deferribacteraceae bacterium]
MKINNVKRYKLTLKNALYRFDNTAVLRLPDVSADFEKMLVIKGRIGSGKTMLLKTLGGVVCPSSGEALLSKTEASGKTGQTYGYFVHSQPEFNFVTGTVGDELDFAGISGDAFTPYLKRNVNELSGGELKKIAVMMALAASEDVVLLDEPLDMLDDLQCELMAEYIAEKSVEKPVIIATHDGHFDKCADVLIHTDDETDRTERFIAVPYCIDRLCERNVFSDKLLSVRDFAVCIGDKILSKISVDSNAGEIVSLFGMNGSGKTLFARTAGGIGKLNATGGLEWNVEKRLRGFCMQFPEHMAYQETIFQEIADITGRGNAGAVIDALGWRGREDSSPFLLSEGEKRIMYIVAILSCKQYCLFDEPFAGLDTKTAYFIADLMIKARNGGKGIFYTTNRKSHTVYADKVINI